VPHVRAQQPLFFEAKERLRKGREKHSKNFVFVPRTLVRTWGTQGVLRWP
jgi:hypothetical protein